MNLSNHLMLLRSQDSQAMADRITDEVNSILSQEDGAQQLSKQAVLDLIDQGASQGGPEARSHCLPHAPLSCVSPACLLRLFYVWVDKSAQM